MESIVERFNSYRISRPNLANCWLAYLELKKKHYEAHTGLLEQAHHVLDAFDSGHGDIAQDDITLMIIYYHAVMI